LPLNTENRRSKPDGIESCGNANSQELLAVNKKLKVEQRREMEREESVREAAKSID